MLCLVQGITGTAAVAGDRNSKINSSDGSSSEKLDSTGNANVKWGMLRKSRYLYFVVIDVCMCLKFEHLYLTNCWCS